MASIEVTITGVLYDKQRRTTQNVVLIGEASYSGLGVGGGPMPPGGGPGAPVDPGFGNPWFDPHPEHPIARPPVGGGGGAHPSHPIFYPPPSPPVDGADKPPPEGEAGWGWYDGRWGFFPGPGQATPKG